MHPNQQNVEYHLMQAPVMVPLLRVHEGSHPGKSRQWLWPGVEVMVKPSDTLANGLQVVSGEAAAWQVANVLGFEGMVGGTVLRPMYSWKTATVGAVSSVQVTWPSTIQNPTTANVPDEDGLKAGVFDYVINNTDRGDNGHNWGVTEQTEYGWQPGLKLWDNANAWAPGPVANSFFVANGRGDSLPPDVLAGVGRLAQCAKAGGLSAFLDPGREAGVAERCDQLLAAGCIPLPLAA